VHHQALRPRPPAPMKHEARAQTTEQHHFLFTGRPCYRVNMKGLSRISRQSRLVSVCSSISTVSVVGVVEGALKNIVTCYNWRWDDHHCRRWLPTFHLTRHLSQKKLRNSIQLVPLTPHGKGKCGGKSREGASPINHTWNGLRVWHWLSIRNS